MVKELKEKIYVKKLLYSIGKETRVTEYDSPAIGCQQTALRDRTVYGYFCTREDAREMFNSLMETEIENHPNFIQKGKGSLESPYGEDLINIYIEEQELSPDKLPENLDELLQSPQIVEHTEYSLAKDRAGFYIQKRWEN